MSPLRGNGKEKEIAKRYQSCSPKEQHQGSCHASSDSNFRPCKLFLKDDEVSPAPLVQLRDLARPSGQALSRLPASSSTLRSPVRNVTRAGGTSPAAILFSTDDEVISVDIDNIMQESQHFTPPHAQNQFPIEDNDLIAHYQGTIEVQQVATLPESKYDPLNDDGPEMNTAKAVHGVSASLSRSQSFNITEFARQLAHEDEDLMPHYQPPVKVQKITTLPEIHYEPLKGDGSGKSATKHVHGDALSLTRSQSINVTECAESMSMAMLFAYPFVYSYFF